MRKLRKLSPLLLVILMNLIGFGILYFSDDSMNTTTLYYSLALLAIVLISYMFIVFLSMGDVYPFLIVSALLTIGIIMLTRLDADKAIRQITWFCVGMIGFFSIYFIFKRFFIWDRLFPAYAGLAFLLFVATLLVGTTVNGARNWLFGIQPSEPIKLLFILGLSVLFTHPHGQSHNATLAFFDRHLPFLKGPVRFFLRIMDSPTGRNFLIMAYAYMHLGFLVLQREWGSAVVYFLIYFVMQFVFDNKYYFLIINILFAGCGGFLGFKYMSHIQQRVAIWQDPFAVSSDLGYQIIRSLYAMSAGGFTGAGLGQGLPESVPVVHSDFIFAAIYEELGMMGATAVVLLFFMLVYRGIKISLMVKTPFYKAVSLGISAMYGFQSLIIIGGVTKMIPLTGITLPFMSAGGSSLATSFAALAILQAISSRKEDMSDAI